MAITFQAYATNSGAYKANKPMPAGSPTGIIVHSTGTDNPYLKRYVNAPEICGENPYKNYFDRTNCDVCPHGVIGLDKNGDVKAAKILPWNICCWGCGNGSKGSYNYRPAYIQIEICEDDLTNKDYFLKAFKLMAQLCNRLMKNYPTIKLENIISHKEANKRGYASGHVDCDHWLAKFGYDMNWFRELVKNNGELAEEYKVIATRVFKDESIAKSYVSLLKQQGCDVKLERK